MINLLVDLSYGWLDRGSGAADAESPSVCRHFRCPRPNRVLSFIVRLSRKALGAFGSSSA